MSRTHIQWHLLLLCCFVRITEYNGSRISSIEEIGYTLMQTAGNKYILNFPMTWKDINPNSYDIKAWVHRINAGKKACSYGGLGHKQGSMAREGTLILI